MTKHRPGDFENLDKADDPEALLSYLDVVGALEAAKEYKSRSFELLGIGSGHAALDVGCGTGDDARALANRVGPSGRVVGVDSSETAIREAIRRSAGSSAPVEFRVDDALHLSFPADEFDGARADRVFQHLADPAAAVRELVRVTRSGGRVVVSDMDWGTLVMDSPDQETTREVVRCQLDAVRSAWVGRQLRAMFLDAGLTDVEVHPVSAVMTRFGLADHLIHLTWLSEAAVQASRVTAAQAAAWLMQLQEADQADRFFLAAHGYTVTGRKLGD